MQRLWIPAFAGMTEYRTDPHRHSRADGNPVATLEPAIVLNPGHLWIPAYAGMTKAEAGSLA